jgi:hypothetical protein
MSYARTSEDDSDIYLYGSKTHLELMVSNNRGSAGKVEQPKAGDSRKKWDEWMADVIPFDNPYAGEHMSFETYSGCIDTLKMMRTAGVRVPARVFDRLVAEQKERGDIYSL